MSIVKTVHPAELVKKIDPITDHADCMYLPFPKKIFNVLFVEFINSKLLNVLIN